MARTGRLSSGDLLRERADPSAEFAQVRWDRLPCYVGLEGSSRIKAGSGPHPPGWELTVAIAAGVAFFAAYGLPALMSLMPGSIVILSDKGVNNNVHTGRGWSIRFWPWEDIDHLSAH